jgi:hypothetical protein
MTRFIILSHNRSGSHFLHRYLASHRDIRCSGELFWHRNFGNHGYNAFLNRTFWKKLCDPLFHRMFVGKYLTEFYNNNSNYKAAGFLLKYSQANRRKGIIIWIKKNNIKVIHLIRSNVVMRNMACEIRKRGILPSVPVDSKNFDNRILHAKVRVAPRPFIDKLISNKNLIFKFRGIFSDYVENYCELFYDQLFSSLYDETQRILNFLDVDLNSTLSSNLIRIEPDTAADMLENYDEIEKALSETEFKDYLTQLEINFGKNE